MLEVVEVLKEFEKIFSDYYYYYWKSIFLLTPLTPDPNFQLGLTGKPESLPIQKQT